MKTNILIFSLFMLCLTALSFGQASEYGIAAYKTVDNFAQAEGDWLMQIGGIVMETDKALGFGISLDGLQADFDAVFLGIGLQGVNALRADGDDKDGVTDAVGFIQDLRQAENLSSLPVGRNVVVIGGGVIGVSTALCLAEDDLTVDGGFWTPAAAMCALLRNRVVEHAGIGFELMPDSDA